MPFDVKRYKTLCISKVHFIRVLVDVPVCCNISHPPVMSVILGFVCGFVLNLFHVLFSFYMQFKLLKFMIYKRLYSAKQFFKNKLKRYRFEQELISRRLKTFSKIPKHLTFAIGEEIVCYSDLIQLIIWSLPTGIPVISFYDHKNELNAEKLYKTFIKTHKNLATNIKWGVSFKTENNQPANNSSPTLQVNILNSKHSRQLLIDSIKELCKKNELKLEDRAATEAALDDIMLSKLSYCGNPDLMVISGSVYTTFGLSPWHLGFTEFSIIPSYRFLTVDDFINVLASYARCDQKFGT